MAWPGEQCVWLEAACFREQSVVPEALRGQGSLGRDGAVEAGPRPAAFQLCAEALDCLTPASPPATLPDLLCLRRAHLLQEWVLWSQGI